MGTQWEQWLTLFLGGFKITADGDCSHEIKKTLTSWKESYDQPRHIKKQRYYFANKGLSSQGYGFSSRMDVCMYVMYGCESWTIKKAECQELMLLNCGVGEDS